MRDSALGVRLAGAGGLSGWLRMVLMAAGSAAAVVVVFTSFGLARVVDRQDARAQHIAPVLAADAGSANVNAVLIADGWERRELRRVVLASDVDVPTPPGLSRPPSAGEVMMSPALERLAATEPLIAGRFPQARGPLIEPEGLVAPDQLLAYLGAPSSEIGPLSSVVESFGDPSASSRLDPRAARTIAMLIALLLIAPVVMFMVVCARLSANSRTQRLVALRLLGLTRRRTQLVNASEIGVTAAAGSVAGLIVWNGWLWLQPEVRLGVFAWYSSDIRLPVWQQCTIVGALVVTSVAVAATASRDAISQPSRTRRDRSSRHISPWRLAPLTAGAVVLIVARVRADVTALDDFESWVLLFGAGLGLTAIGLVIAAPLAAVFIGRTMMRSSRPPVLLAGSRLRHDPSSTSRVVAALAVALFAAGVAQTVAVALDRSAADNQHRIPAVVNLEIIGPATDANTYQSLSALAEPLASFRIGSPGNEIDAIAATCTQLRAATIQPLTDCRDGNVQLAQWTEPSTNNSSDPVYDALLAEALADAALPSPTSAPLEMTIPFVDGYFTPAVIVPPQLAPATASRFYIPIPADQYDTQTLTTALAAQSPTAIWNPLITQIDRLDTARVYRGFIAAGTLAALMIGAAALTIATIANAIEHRSRLRALAAIGANPASIRLSIVLQTAPISLGLLVLASVAALVGGNAYLQFSYPGSTIPLRALSALLAFSVAATTAAALLAATAVTHLNRNEIVRQE